MFGPLLVISDASCDCCVFVGKPLVLRIPMMKTVLENLTRPLWTVNTLSFKLMNSVLSGHGGKRSEDFAPVLSRAAGLSLKYNIILKYVYM